MTEASQNENPPWLAREAALIGGSATACLRQSRVLLFGTGGVGGYIAEALVRAGIGYLCAVDFDRVDITNINRQIIADTETVGVEKAELIAKRAKKINPEIEVVPVTEFITPHNAAEVIERAAPHFIADAVDNVSAKLSIIEEAIARKIPVISCMGTGNKLDPLRFRITDISKTSVCPLARVMRYELKKRGISGGVPTLWSDETPHTNGGSRTPASISYVPAAAGLIIAGHIIRTITEDAGR